MELKNIQWRRAEHGLIKEPLLDYLEKLIDEQYELGRKVKLCVGTDSQKSGKGGFKYATVIILEMKEPTGIKIQGKMTYKGLGAKVILGTFTEKFKPSIRERMLKEAQMSINVCFHILDLVELYDVDLEIHADVNPNPIWASNVALNEVVGFCKGMNLTYRIKPNAYAASSCADKFCNN